MLTAILIFVIGLGKANAAVTVTKVESLTFITITGDIEHEILKYQPILHALDTAKAGDTIILNITTPGGSAKTGMKIIEALNNTKAYTVASISSAAYSMGAYISCYTDRVAMGKGSELMFHHGSVLLEGRWSIIGLKNLVERHLALVETLNKQCKKVGLITDKDIATMGKGADVYVSAATINKRLKAKTNKTLQSKGGAHVK